MRAQWCREHIDEVQENCGLEKSTVSDVKQAAKFCASVSDFSDCPTSTIIALIRVKDEEVKNRAISLARNALNGQTPTGGKKKTRFTKPEIRKIIKKAEVEVRGEMTEEFKKEAEAEKKPASPYQPQPNSIPVTDAPPQPSLAEQLAALPKLSPDAPMSEVLKMDKLKLELFQKEAALGFQTAANEKVVMNGGTVTLPPKYKITPEPMTEKEADDLILQVINRWFAPKSKELWNTILASGELSDSPARLFEALVCRIGGE